MKLRYIKLIGNHFQELKGGWSFLPLKNVIFTKCLLHSAGLVDSGRTLKLDYILLLLSSRFNFKHEPTSKEAHFISKV